MDTNTETTITTRTSYTESKPDINKTNLYLVYSGSGSGSYSGSGDFALFSSSENKEDFPLYLLILLIIIALILLCICLYCLCRDKENDVSPDICSVCITDKIPSQPRPVYHNPAYQGEHTRQIDNISIYSLPQDQRNSMQSNLYSVPNDYRSSVTSVQSNLYNTVEGIEDFQVSQNVRVDNPLYHSGSSIGSNDSPRQGVINNSTYITPNEPRQVVNNAMYAYAEEETHVDINVPLEEEEVGGCEYLEVLESQKIIHRTILDDIEEGKNNLNSINDIKSNKTVTGEETVGRRKGSLIAELKLKLPDRVPKNMLVE